MTAALEARLREMDERLRLLQEENERLRTGAYATAAPVPEPTSEGQEPEEAELGPFDGLEDDAYPQEEDGGLVELLELSNREEDEEQGEEGFDFDEDETDETEDEDEYGEDEEDEEAEGEDFMSAFCSFAASLMDMTPFERMRTNGKEVMEISLEDLSAEIKAQAERRSRGE